VRTLLLELIFENAADGMCIIDNNSNIIKVNERLSNLLEISKEELLTKKCFEIYSGSLCNSIDCPRERIAKGEYYITYEIEQKVGEKTIPFLVTGTPLLTKDKTIEGIILTFKDITTIVKYQHQLSKAKQRAEEANKLKNQFIANVSHEIRTPMNGIIGIVELLEGTELTSIQRDYVDMLKFSSDRLLSIINNILDFSKIEANKFKPIYDEFSLADLVQDIGQYFKIQANKKGLDFYYKINGQIPGAVIGDAERLSQVLFNIIGNAVKFTEAGLISFNTEICCQDKEHVGVKFMVKDTGIGIPDEKIKSIFENFNQLDLSSTKKYGGTGLGLTISKKLIELMGGEIQVSSQLYKGSTFVVDLKFPKEKFEVYEKDFLDIECNYEKIKDLPSLDILVADDDLINQKIIKNILEKKHWKVTIASNGKEVLEHLENSSYDLILMDVFMPEMDGCKVANMIREREKDTGGYTPIIALTAAAMKEDKERCLRAGMDEYIYKPIRSNMMYKKILDLLEKRKEKGYLNMELLLDRLSGDRDVLIDIIKELTSDEYEKEYIEGMKKIIDKGNLQALEKSIHKLKGSIINFGALNIINILQKIDDNIRKQDLLKINELYKDLRIEFTKTIDQLGKYNIG